MKFWPTVTKIVIMLGLVTVIVDTIIGDGHIVKGIGNFLGSLIGDAVPDQVNLP